MLKFNMSPAPSLASSIPAVNIPGQKPPPGSWLINKERRFCREHVVPGDSSHRIAFCHRRQHRRADYPGRGAAYSHEMGLWESAFIIMGATGLIWLIFWLWIYQSPQHHSKVSPAELDYMRSDPPDPMIKIPWLKLLAHRLATLRVPSTRSRDMRGMAQTTHDLRVYFFRREGLCGLCLPSPHRNDRAPAAW